MSHHASTTAALATAALALTGALPALAAGQDLRSPDTRDAATRTATPADPGSPDTRDAATRTATPVDLRSPDTRDAATRTATPVDLRSPDTRDVGRPRRVVPLRIVTVADDRFDWSDAAIGAGGALGLALLLAGGASTVARRRAGRGVTA